MLKQAFFSEPHPRPRNIMQSGIVPFMGPPFRTGVALFLPVFFFLPLSLVSIQLPWVYSIILNISLVLAGTVLLKPVIGMYLLLFTVPVSSFICYLAVEADWNFITGMSYIDTVPVYLPFILFSFIGLILNQWAGVLPTSNMNPLRIPCLVLLAYASATVFWADSRPHSFFQFVILFFNVLLFSLIVALIRDRIMLRRVLWLWSLSIGFQAFFALTSFFFDSALISNEIRPDILVGFNFFGSFFQPSGWPQVASGLQDHHETALLMNMTSHVVIALLLTSQKRSQRCFLAVLLFVMVFVTLRTESRAAFGALFISGSALFFLLKKLRGYLIRMLTLFLLTIFLVYSTQHAALSIVLQKNFMPRLFSLGMKVVETGDAIDPGLDDKSHGRRKLWQKSFSGYGKVALRGFGVGNMKKEMQAPHAHSIYFSLLFDFGVIGIFFLIWLAGYLVTSFIRPLKEQQTELQIIASSFIGGILVICIQGLVDFEYNTTTIWVFLALTTATLNMVRLERQESGPISFQQH